MGTPCADDVGQSSLMKSYPSLTDLPIWKLHLEVRIQSCFLTLHKDTLWLSCRQAISFLKAFSGKNNNKKRGYDAGKKQERRKGSFQHAL